MLPYKANSKGNYCIIIYLLVQAYILLIILPSAVLSDTRNFNHPINKDDRIALQQLGRQLFFEARLSYNCAKSCASCHAPELAFTDGYRRSIGAGGDILSSNSPSLLNLAPTNNNKIISYEMLLRRIKKRLVVPLYQNKPLEMGANLARNEIITALNSSAIYKSLLAKVSKDTKLSWPLIESALAHYVISLNSRSSLFDLITTSSDKYSFSAVQRRGKELFYSVNVGCSKCHSGIDLGNAEIASELSTEAAQVGFLGNTRIYKIPSLRNVALTAPYFRDGSFNTLSDVIKSKDSAKNLNSNDIEALIEFLYSLTDLSYRDSSYFNAPASASLCK